MAVRCLAGLGNPGSRYAWTRHNIGFLVVEKVARDAGLSWRRLPDALEAAGEVGGDEVVLVKPLTYMNCSGPAVLDCLERHRLNPEDLLVVVDDTSLPFARLRLRRGGGSGGHRGLDSIEESLGTRDYGRLRIGIGSADEGEELADFVLREIDPEGRVRFEQLAEIGARAVQDAVERGLDWAMNRYNPPAATEVGGPGDPGEE